jgi:hypothetical protein
MASIVKVTEDEIVGHTYREPDLVNARLKQAAGEYNLVAPATRVGDLPPGCGVSMSVLRVDPRITNPASKQGPDVYQVDGGKLALQKHVLDRLAAAVGVAWDPRTSGRLDDGRDAHYCRYRASGVYRDFSGRTLAVSGEYELDLRDGSERSNTTPKNLGNMRKFIVARAETGARTRAISAMGIKRAYEPHELDKPFVIASLHFDGRSADPETQRILTQETARAMLGGTAALFGVSPQPAFSAPVLPASSLRDEVIEAEQDDERPSEPPPAKAAAKVYTLPDAANTPITQADTARLERAARRIDDDLTDHVYVAEDVPSWVELRDAIIEEIKRRGSGSTEPKGGY